MINTPEQSEILNATSDTLTPDMWDNLIVEKHVSENWFTVLYKDSFLDALITVITSKNV